jgi:hypothetical protein
MKDFILDARLIDGIACLFTSVIGHRGLNPTNRWRRCNILKLHCVVDSGHINAALVI